MSVNRYGEWIISTKAHSTAVSPDRERVYSFDLEGRPISWFESDRVYKRGLDSRVHLRFRPSDSRNATRTRRVLSDREATERLDGVLAVVAEFPLARADPQVRRRIRKILAWSGKTLGEERTRFCAAYRPIPILPPDEYFSIVLQATFGCTWNACTFCSFYLDRNFSLRPLDRFREHLEQVRALLGEAAALRRRLFLADGNALMLANDRLIPIIEAAGNVFPDRSFSGFVDVFSGRKKSVEQWRLLYERGLRRVHVGIETGLDDLLRFVNKPGSAKESLDFLQTLASAKIDRSLILMAGLGGRRYASAHREATLDLLSKMELGPRDIVYVSPFHEPTPSDGGESAYAHRAAAEKIEPLSSEETRAEAALLARKIRALQPHPRIAPYELAEFFY